MPTPIIAPDVLHAAVLGDVFWEQQLQHLFTSSRERVALHLAILVDPYLQLMLDGKKTIESRFSINRRPDNMEIGKPRCKFQFKGSPSRWALPYRSTKVGLTSDSLHFPESSQCWSHATFWAILLAEVNLDESRSCRPWIRRCVRGSAIEGRFDRKSEICVSILRGYFFFSISVSSFLKSSRPRSASRSVSFVIWAASM